MKSNKGFSLVELIVVIAIMAIIAAVAVPVYNTYIDKAQNGSDASTIAEAFHAADIAASLNNATFTYDFDDDNKKFAIVFANSDAGKADAGKAACTDAAAVLTGIATKSGDIALVIEFDHAVKTTDKAVTDITSKYTAAEYTFSAQN